MNIPPNTPIEASGWPYYGGSYRLVRPLLRLLPPDTIRIVEAFCGSAVFSLNVPWLPRVVNDKNGDVIHLLRVIREQPDQLAWLLAHTPYHQAEFAIAVLPIPSDCSDLERARRLFIRYGMARGGGGQELLMSDWSRSISEQRRGMMGAVAKFRSRIQRLDTLAARLADVQFEWGDFADLTRYDHPHTFWFLDPPWEPQTRVAYAGERYEYEFTPSDYERLATFAHARQGRVVVLGYRGGMMSELFQTWHTIPFDIVLSAGQSRGQREVVAWVNQPLATCLNTTTEGLP